MKPLIFAKAALNKNQIAVKKSIGCDGIEIQLLNELFEPKRGHYLLEEVFNLEDFRNEPVLAVHAPLLKGYGDLTIEQMADVEDKRVFLETCRLANYFGEIQNREIIVIVHSETFMGFIKGIGNTLYNIESMFATALEKYPHIKIGIENVTPCRGVGKGQTLHLSNNFKNDNVEMALYFREKLKTDRIGTVLDTCHAMIAKKYIDTLYAAMGDREPEDLRIEKYFEWNKDTCFLIHLSDMKGSGYGSGRHGIPFTRENMNMAFALLTFYRMYGYKCPITLEVEETDFSVCDGYKHTKEIVDDFFTE